MMLSRLFSYKKTTQPSKELDEIKEQTRKQRLLLHEALDELAAARRYKTKVDEE